jgi:hypothetical protein
MKKNLLMLLIASCAALAFGTQGWQRYTPGKTGISVELPGKPEPMPLDLPEDVKKEVSSMENHMLFSGDFFVVLSKVTYTTAQVNLQGAADGAVQRVQATPGYQGKSFTQKPFKLGALSAIYIHGEYSISGDPVVHHQIVAAKGKTLWQVVITYDARRTERAAEARRILDSVSISG